MVFKYSRYISVSISSDTVKIAQIRNSGHIEKLVKRQVENSAPDVALVSALAGFKVKGSGVICVVPADVVTLKSIEVPSVEKEELDSILALQAARQTPFNKDEILTGYINLGRPKPNVTRALLIVVKRDTVKEKMTLMKRAGFETSFVQFVPEGIAQFYSVIFKHKKSDAPVAIVDFGKKNATFMVEAQSVLLSSRSIPVGLDQLSAGPESVQQFMDELKVSLDSYEQQGGRGKPGRFVFTCTHSALEEVKTAILTAHGVKVDSLPYINFVQADKQIKDVLAKDFSADTALDVIAPAMYSAKCQADLVPQEIKDHRAVLIRGRETFKAGALVIVFLFFVGGALCSKVYFKDTFLKQNLIEKYAQQKLEVRNLETMAGKTRILREHMMLKDIPLEAIRELYRLVPDEIYLSNISMDISGTMSVQGVSDSMSQVFAFVTSLEDSDFFEGVKTKSTTTRKERGKDVAAFEITFSISSFGAQAAQSSSSIAQDK